MGRFIAANAIGGGVNFLIYAVLVTWSAAVAHYPVIGVACGSLAGLFVNFELSRRLVFSATRSA